MLIEGGKKKELKRGGLEILSRLTFLLLSCLPEDDTLTNLPINPPKTPFTTPPTTSKRKAAEAANETTTTTAATKPPVAVAAGSRNATSRASSFTTSSGKARKIEQEEEKEEGKDTPPEQQEFGETDSVSSAGELPVPERKTGRDPITPATTSMESDDDFMSDASSQDFLDTQGSDDESLGGNVQPSIHNIFCLLTFVGGLDFVDDIDGGFSQDKDIVGHTKKPYEVDFKVLSPEDIEREQNVQINEVSSIVGLPPESSAILLRYGRWNREKLIESYMDKPEETLEDAGLGTNFESTPTTQVIPGFMCEICCEDGDDLQTYAMRCGHRFCVDCYQHYLGQKIREEGEAARIECPGNGCHMIVDSKSLDLLVTDDLKDR